MEKRKRGRPKKSINAPAVDKMVKEPERNKQVYELLAERERSIHGGTGIIR